MPLSRHYLVAYNVLSALAWLAILVEVVVDLLPGGYYHTKVYSGYPHKLLVVTQTVNVATELTHAATGLVPSPILALLPQFFARCVIAWGISYHVPESAGNYSLCYAAFVVAWSVTEVFRYSFYAGKQLGHVPYWLLWMRYLTFIVLYPCGLATEPVVVFQTLPYVSGFFYWFLAVGLLLYVPGFVRLYGYMWKQRRRNLMAKEPAKAE